MILTFANNSDMNQIILTGVLTWESMRIFFFYYFELCREICNTQGESHILKFFILLGRSELRRDFLKFVIKNV